MVALNVNHKMFAIEFNDDSTKIKIENLTKIFLLINNRIEQLLLYLNSKNLGRTLEHSKDIKLKFGNSIYIYEKQKRRSNANLNIFFIK